MTIREQSSDGKILISPKTHAMLHHMLATADVQLSEAVIGSALVERTINEHETLRALPLTESLLIGGASGATPGLLLDADKRYWDGKYRPTETKNQRKRRRRKARGRPH